jgi:hypothetical protein
MDNLSAEDKQWMSLFAANTTVSHEHVPTTSRVSMGNTSNARTKRRRDGGSSDEENNHGMGAGDEDMNGAEEHEINSLFGIHIDTDRSEHDEERERQVKRQKDRKQQLPKPSDSSNADKLREMLNKTGARIVSITSSGKPVAAKTPSTVAEILRQRKELEESSASDKSDDTPRPITSQQKYEEAVRRRYTPITYDSVDSSDESNSNGNSSNNEGEDHAKKQYNATHKRECFLCAYGDRFHDGIEAPLVNRLHSIFESNYGKVENAAVAQMLYLYFRKRIWTKGMKMLTQEIALEHIEQMHTLDPRIAVGELIRRYMRMFTAFENDVFLSDGTFNKSAVGAMNAAGRMILTLYKSDPIKMNFYNPKMDIDPKQLGTFTNIMSIFTTRHAAPSASRKRSRSRSRSPSPSRTSTHKRTEVERAPSYSSPSSSPSPVRKGTKNHGNETASSDRDAKRRHIEPESHFFF